MAYNKPKGKPYRPDYISRKMFDLYQDRINIRVARIKEDYRSDIAAVLARVQNLEHLWDQLFPIEERGQEDDVQGTIMPPGLTYEQRREEDRRSRLG